MTDDQRLSALIDSWLVEGPKRMPDRVVDVVSDRISHQSQRAAWRFPGRELHMPTYPRIAAAVAAIAIVAIGGIYLWGQPGAPGIGGPAATQSPSPSAVSTPTASPALLSSFIFSPKVTVQAPAGWTVDGDGVRTFGLKPPAGPTGPGAGSILVMSGPFVDAADAECEGRPAVGAGTTIAEIVAAFSSHAAVSTTLAGTVDVGDRTGQVLDVQLVPTWTKTCSWSQGNPATLLLLATADGPGFGLQGTERGRLILTELDGKVVAIIISAADGPTQAEAVALATPVVESIQFTP